MRIQADCRKDNGSNTSYHLRRVVFLNDNHQPGLPLKIILAPRITINSWLARNPKALASVKRGLKQASFNEGRYLGSFAEFANLDIDDEDIKNQ